MEETVNKIICDDVLSGLKKITDNSVHLIFSSPPYNVKINYGNHEDDMLYDDYLLWLKTIFIECKRVLVPGGRIAINIDAMTNRQVDKDKEYVRCIYAHLYNIMTEIGLLFRTEICWYKQNSVGKATAWGSYLSCSNPIIRRNHEYILVFSKDGWKLGGDPELSDMSKEEFEAWTFSTWFIHPETKKVGGHPVPFPEELAKRVIKLFSYRGNTIMDIFSGSGTVPYVAYRLGRKYIGIDNEEKYCDFARDRIEQVDNSLFPEIYVPRSERIKSYKTLKNKKEGLF